MKLSRMIVMSSAVVAIASWGQAAHADGKKQFADACSECHEVADFQGESAADLTASLKKIVAGQQKHKKALKLSDAEISELATYMAAGK